MINVAEFIYETRIGKFVCSTKAELNKLPRINTPGQDNLITFKSCAQGSMARVIGGDDDDIGYYELNGDTNTWVKKKGCSGGGGGGDIDPTDIADKQDIDSIFGDMF